MIRKKYNFKTALLCLLFFCAISCTKKDNKDIQGIVEKQEVIESPVEDTIQSDKMQLLTKAIYDGDIDVVKLVVEEDKTLLDKLNKYKLTPLASSCSAGSEEIVQYLLSQGADVNKASIPDSAESPIMYAVKNHEIVKQLITHGADVNKGDPLSRAAFEGYYKSVVLLVENGANINTPDYGSLPLRGAAVQHHIDVVRYLLSKGADVTYNDTEPGPDMGTVLDAAIKGDITEVNVSKEKREQIIKMLRDAGAKTAEELENQE